MRVSGAAEILKKELEAAKVKGATYLDDAGEQFRTCLDKLIARRCTKFCRVGGGSACRIKQCCLSKGFEGCWECTNFEDCDMLTEQFLGYCKKIKKLGIAGFIKEA